MYSQITLNRQCVKIIMSSPVEIQEKMALASIVYLLTGKKETFSQEYSFFVEMMFDSLRKSYAVRRNKTKSKQYQNNIKDESKVNQLLTDIQQDTTQLNTTNTTKEQETNKKETTPLKDNINTPIKKEIKKKEKKSVDVPPTQEELNFQDMMKQYPRVAKMDSPLTLTKWNNAVKKMCGYVENEEQAKNELMLVLEAMDNYKLLKNYVDAGRVLDKWCHYETRTPIKRIEQSQQPTLGVDEYISKKDGKRYYGEGRVAVPFSAPPRPSTGYSWIYETARWEKSF